MAEAVSPGGRERRRYFRVRDQVGLAWRVVPADREAVEVAGFEAASGRFGLLNQVRALRQNHLPERRRLLAKAPTVSAYIDLLEKQIDYLAQALVDGLPSGPMTPTEVDLSAQGLGLRIDDGLATGDLVEIRLQLLPSRGQLLALARAVKVEADAGGRRAALEFIHLREADREAIIHQVHQVQMRELQDHADADGQGGG